MNNKTRLTFKNCKKQLRSTRKGHNDTEREKEGCEIYISGKF